MSGTYLQFYQHFLIFTFKKSSNSYEFSSLPPFIPIFFSSYPSVIAFSFESSSTYLLIVSNWIVIKNFSILLLMIFIVIFTRRAWRLVPWVIVKVSNVCIIRINPAMLHSHHSWQHYHCKMCWHESWILFWLQQGFVQRLIFHMSLHLVFVKWYRFNFSLWGITFEEMCLYCDA